MKNPTANFFWFKLNVFHERKIINSLVPQRRLIKFRKSMVCILFSLNREWFLFWHGIWELVKQEPKSSICQKAAFGL